MHITALCPFCRQSYQVEEKLRGLSVRCPNASCRKVFSVPQDDSGTNTPPTSPSRSNPPSSSNSRSGSVGDMVPILPTEEAQPPQDSSAASKSTPEVYPLGPEKGGRAAQEGDWRQAAPPVRAKVEREGERQTPPPRKAATPESAPAADTGWWQNAPPTRTSQQRADAAPTPGPSPPPSTQRIRRTPRPQAETQQMPAISPDEIDQLRELPPGAWDAPPVRRGIGNQEQEVQPVDEAEEIEEEEAPAPRVSKRIACLSIVAMIAVVFIALGGGGYLVLQKLRVNEEQVRDEAYQSYKNGAFSDAQDKFKQLDQHFPNSTYHAEYRFMIEWCGLCRMTTDPEADLSETAVKLDQLIREHKKKPYMVELSRDAGQRLLHLVKLLDARSSDPTDERLLAAVDRIEQLWRTVTGLGGKGLTANESEQIDAELGKIRKLAELAHKRSTTLAQISVQPNEAPMDAIKRSQALLGRMERELPGITDTAKAALEQLEKIHLESIQYQEAKDVPPSPPAPAGDDADILLFAPPLQAAPERAPPNDPIVMALVRGVLYALKQSTGELKWATHVGIDTTVLPLRVPRSAFTEELLLVLSADSQTLSALNVNGDALWEYHIGQPVLGRPIIIDQRAYLPDYSGLVHEIELSRGQLLGRWNLGQPLTCGGTREAGTSRIYFPADDSCIYVLDVNPKVRRCVAILYDGHPAGSLRSGPVVIPPEGDTGYLVLNEASGLDAMRLRVFELPLQDSHAPPLTLSSQVRLAGWTWFEAKQDGEKMAVLSDAGILGLFGIRQLGNSDPPLFPLLRSGELDLSSFLHQQNPSTKDQIVPRERGRSLVADMRSNNMWVLAHGHFQQLRLCLKAATGPQAVPVWKAPLELGSPLHEPQLLKDGNGRSTFYLATQALNQQTCLATAVSEDGRVLWQRQLGSVCQGQPLALTPPSGGAPVLVMMDQGGGLYQLDPDQPDRLRSNRHTLKPALPENPRVPPRLMLAADGQSAYEIAVPGNGEWLILRHIHWAAGGRDLDVSERKVSLQEKAVTGVYTPVGLPALTKSQLLIPMSDGNVQGVSLTQDDPSPLTGPSWSQSQTNIIAPAILPLSDDRFLIFNGNRILAVYEWPPGKGNTWQELPRNGDRLKPLEYLVAAPPVVLPARNQPPRVVVADSTNTLRLFTVAQDGGLQPGRTWPLKGNLTTGPFVQATPEGGWRIGCVLDRRQLIWIDPDKDEPLWRYSTDGPTILGQPQFIEDMLVVGLQSGGYVGIDPKTGKPKGPGYGLRTSAAPAAVPMPFGKDHMFAPLSDGTALLLSVELLKKPNHRVTENTEKNTEKKN